MNSSSRLKKLLDSVQNVLISKDFRSYSSRFDRRSLIRKANSLGGPPFQMLHWKRLIELGRVPNSNEKEAVDAIAGINAFGANEVEIFMVSHRWLRPSVARNQGHPDSIQNRKAKAINQFSLWRREWVLHKHGFLPEIYYWIDYSCIDQSNPAEAIAMLPLWIACCERFVRIEAKDYDERMWCRVEPLLSHVFSFADHHLSIGLDFSFKWPYFGTEIKWALLDPLTGKTTIPEDKKLVSPLVELATQTQPANSSRTKVQFGETVVKCYRL